MNFISEQWLRVVMATGEQSLVRPSEVSRADVVDLRVPRPDFQGSVYQWLIGLFQTTFAPVDEDEWHQRWDQPPSPHELDAAFAPWADAFRLDGDGPAFMQDLTPAADFRPKNIGELLIDQGSEANQYFAVPGAIDGMCPACAATALYTLQCNAPSGGVGHRVSMRGGGPLTTLLKPPDVPDRPATLWQRLWLNVLPASEIRQSTGSYRGKDKAAIFPWLATTRSSEQKSGQTSPADAHALQAYWGMPRRIRLDWSTAGQGMCGICRAPSERVLRRYLTKNYGVNYLGWAHPLTPYYLDPKKKELPLSVKGQKGGIAYRHWVGLVLGDEGQPEPAQVVRHYVKERWSLLGHSGAPRLWVFGFDLDNMKARCWYDTTLPVHAVAPELQIDFAKVVKALLGVAAEAASLLRTHVKHAWAKRPKDLKDEPSVQQSFWQATESSFYASINALHRVPGLSGPALAFVYEAWLDVVREQTLTLFDQWVEGAYELGWNIERVVKARSELEKWLQISKPMKAFRDETQRRKKEAA